MSLVAYGSSDSENEDNIDEENPQDDQNTGKVVLIDKKSTSNQKEPPNDEQAIFTSLPKPQTNPDTNDVVEEEEDEFLMKKETPTEKPKKQPVKISIPSLADFEDDEEEEPAKKRKKANFKSSGLFALLPPPKTKDLGSKIFVPNSVKRPTKTAPIKVKKPEIKVNKPEKRVASVDELESDDDDDEFKNLPDTFDDETWQKVCGRREKVVKPIVEEPVNVQSIEIAPEPIKPYEGLDNQAFKELVGANSKRKGESINITDIHEDEILPDKDIWMRKSLTDPEMAPKHVVDDPVNDTCKRKHHITYLAQQAKANEQELQNQWAANKYSRQMTQAKYGF